MAAELEDVIARLEAYALTARQQLDSQPEQASYWRGVLFGLELSLLEARKPPAVSESPGTPPSAGYEGVYELVFNHLEKMITLCQASIKRDLLVYNARVIRYELLRAIRQLAGDRTVSEYEWQAHPDREL